MDYIISNFHLNNCHNLIKKIKKAINPYTIAQSGIIQNTRTSYNYTKLNHIIKNKDFFNKISIINYSKYINSMQQIIKYIHNNKSIIKRISWYKNGKIKEIIIEKDYNLNSDIIKKVKKISYNEYTNIKTVWKMKVINNDYNSATYKAI
jgi:hypothetical protein